MAEQRCPNCGGPEWFEGAACWHCGWEARPDAQRHTWSEPWRGTPVCLQCGVVQRTDGENGQCTGKVSEMREGTDG